MFRKNYLLMLVFLVVLSSFVSAICAEFNYPTLDTCFQTTKEYLNTLPTGSGGSYNIVENAFCESKQFAAGIEQKPCSYESPVGQICCKYLGDQPLYFFTNLERCQQDAQYEPDAGNCYSWGNCSDGATCPDNSVCDGKNCLPFLDNDGDEKPSLYYVPFFHPPESASPSIDCYDFTRVCNVYANDPTCKVSDSSRRQDCWNFCIDKDGDKFCDDLSVLVGIGNLPAEDLYKSGVTAWIKSRLNDLLSTCNNDPHICPTDIEKAQGLFDKVNSDQGWTVDEIKDAIPFDCNDDDPKISPSEVEDESCDLVNNDCDNQVDECSDWISPLGWDRHSPVNSIDENGAPIGYAVVGPVPAEQGISNTESGNTESGNNLITGLTPKGGGDSQTDNSAVTPTSPSILTQIIHKPRSCAYSFDKKCHVWDFDGDGFKNASFGCQDCTDCNDFDSRIKPDAVDTGEDLNGDGSINIFDDVNCNGVVGEIADNDHDGIPDSFDICDTPGLDKPIDYRGCWFAYSHIVVPPAHDFNNLPRSWSIEP